VSDLGPRIAELYPRLLRYAIVLKRNRDEAEDLAQDTVCRALERASFYRQDTNLFGWLSCMMNRVHLDSLRSARRKPFIVPLDNAPDIGIVPRQETHALANEMVRFISALERRQRRVLELSMAMELTNPEIAERLHIPYGTVCSRLSRGKSAVLERVGAV